MKELTNKETMSSLQIAEISGKRHSHVLDAIRAMEPTWVKVGRPKFRLANYTDNQGKIRPCYELTKTECLYISTKFNDEARAKLVLRWEELEYSRIKQLLKVESISGVQGVIFGGIVYYPYQELVRAVGGVRKASSHRKLRYPEQFVKIAGRNFVSAAYAKVLETTYAYLKAINAAKANLPKLNFGEDKEVLPYGAI